MLLSVLHACIMPWVPFLSINLHHYQLECIESLFDVAAAVNLLTPLINLSIDLLNLHKSRTCIGKNNDFQDFRQKCICSNNKLVERKTFFFSHG